MMADARAHSGRVALEALAVVLLAGIVMAVVADTRLPLPPPVKRTLTFWPALAIAVAAIALRIHLSVRGDADRDRPRQITGVLFRITVLTILVSDLGLVLDNLVMACGGLDSAGYVGSARLFLSGRLTEYQPIARVLPFANPTDAATPLGFVPAATPFYIAPRFPPGLPLVMAASMAIGGPMAPFLVAPALGAGVVVIVYLMTKRIAGAVTAAIAAVMVATGPVFLDLSLQPMSDVPATFWLTLAAFFLWRPSGAVPAALAAGMAILTRPPLVLAVVALALTTQWSPSSGLGRIDRRRPIVFAAVVAAFLVALLALHAHIFGHPLASGYGTAGQLFTFSALAWQAVMHGKWLLVVYTPLLVLLFAAGAVARPRLAGQAAAVFIATAIPYLLYAPRFDHWGTSRFLLPAIPFVLIVCASGVTWLANENSYPVRARAVGTIVAAGIAAASYAFTSSQGVFDEEIQEMRYPLVGEWFATRTPPNAVAIAALHSGSLRIYSNRPTLRLDGIPPGTLLETVKALERANYVPYVVLQADEYEEYSRRFMPDAIPSLVVRPEAAIRGVQILRLTTR